MNESTEDPKVAYLRKRLELEKSARQQAEGLLESKSRELFEINKILERSNEQLDEQVQQRTSALLAQTKLAEDNASRLNSAVERLEIILTAARAVSWTYDITHHTFRVNGGDTSLLQFKLDEVVDFKKLKQALHPDDHAIFRETFSELSYLKSKIDIRLRFKDQDDQYRWFALSAVMSRSEAQDPILLGALIDVQDHVKREEEAWALSNIDSLTQVANRHYFEQLFAKAKQQSQDFGTGFTLGLVDINEFRLINESFGQRTADWTLQALADLLVDRFEDKGSIARLAADEFVILFNSDVKATQAFDHLEQLVTSIDHFELNNGERVAITLSAGAACFPYDGQQFDNLLQAVQTANQQSKQSRFSSPKCVMYHPGMDVSRQRDRNIRQNLHRAVTQDEFSFALQPLATKDGKWLAAEALLRWTKGPRYCSTLDFITVAESCGLILPIGEWVIKNAIQQLSAIQKIRPDFWLSINISPAQFQHQDLASTIQGAAEGTEVDLSRLAIEVTESLFLDDLTRVQNSLDRIKALGCTIAIDDFGSGYSSLGYVQQLPIDYIKIDKRFVDQITEHSESHNITKAIIDMSHSLHSKVVAEGVETLLQVEALAALNCDAMQGYYFARPMAPEQFLAELKHNSERFVAE
ncbi:putative signal transduction protein [Aequoribacter fuscus]|uniref:Putative signal transduction protein n=1 Tax=Aequoribacter fuscus TaxID=2518989 RepID=F3L1T6_9GAMM|nr:GGDEF domain-containing protein [Aequoribacter fuscus]EGG29698.1 putative signal transduction protein [Aequoribacter fuscus]QHJ88971.1 GGDEF domain-containing protein [Aequoribacter fuscus]